MQGDVAAVRPEAAVVCERALYDEAAAAGRFKPA